MFSGVAIGIIVALSSSTWVYTKTMRRTGNNNKSSITTAAIAGFFAFVIIVTLVKTVDSMLGN
jgi:hypothetical protein